MNPRQLVVNPSDRSAPLNVIGHKITVLVSEVDSQTQQITLQSGDEGVGPPPHRHDWDESFFITRGEVQFRCGDKAATCLPGTLVHVPGGTMHSFCFGPGGGEMLEVTGKGSKAVQLFSALDREIPPGPPDVSKVIQVVGKFGVVMLPP
jgi:mannose-6-phosphate isomerase-like protein (cupin superfamily)